MDQQNEEVKCNASFQTAQFFTKTKYFTQAKSFQRKYQKDLICKQYGHMAVNRRSSDEPQSLIPLSFGYILPVFLHLNRSTEPGENLKDDLQQIYTRLTMFNMAVRLLKCFMSYLHNNYTFIKSVDYHNQLGQ